MDSSPHHHFINPELSNPFFGLSNKTYFWLIFGMLLIIFYILLEESLNHIGLEEIN